MLVKDYLRETFPYRIVEAVEPIGAFPRRVALDWISLTFGDEAIQQVGYHKFKLCGGVWTFWEEYDRTIYLFKNETDAVLSSLRIENQLDFDSIWFDDLSSRLVIA
jgi:hypothetical protein